MDVKALRWRVVCRQETYRIPLLASPGVDGHFKRRFDDDNEESTIDRPRRKSETIGIRDFYASLNGSLPRDDQISFLS